MSVLRVALLQMTPFGLDLESNRAKGEEFCRRAAEMGADIALFPEMWSVGYSLPDVADIEETRRWREAAISREDGFVVRFRRLARELDMAIALTYLERWPGAPRNSVSLIDRLGEILFTYAKVHTCDFDREALCTPGDDFYVRTLDTRAGRVETGAMICFDREFPESARILMLKGAEIILVPKACPMDDARISQLKARAFENMLGIATTNYPAGDDTNGHSTAFSGMIYDDAGHALDSCIIEAGEGEGVYLADFNIDRMRAYRRREVWGNAYRRPKVYGLLTSGELRPPFVRRDARR